MNNNIVIIGDLILNILLAFVKLIVGMGINSIGLISDGINNFNDGLSNIIGLVSEYVRKKPADREHPFGHARAEYIATMIISLIIIVTGIMLLKEGFVNLINNQVIIYPPVALIVIIGAIVIKLGIFVVNKRVGTTNNSMTLIAIGYDALSDVLASSGILIAMLIANLSGFHLDGVIAIILSLYIIYSGVKLEKTQIDELLGKGVDPTLSQKIKNIVYSYPDVLECHDLMIHNYGPTKKFATIHLCFDGRRDIYEIHEIYDEIERDVHDQLGVELLVHLDPVRIEDEETKMCEEALHDVLNNYSQINSYHDFRVVNKHHQDHIFVDIQIPYGQTINVSQFITDYQQNLKKLYDIEVTVEYV